MDTVFLSLTKVHRGFLSFFAFAAADFCICLGVRAFLECWQCISCLQSMRLPTGLCPPLDTL